MIGDYGAINAIDLAEKQKTSLRTMYRALSVLSSVDFGLVTREGSKKTGNYVLTLLGKTYYMNYIKKRKFFIPEKWRVRHFSGISVCNSRKYLFFYVIRKMFQSGSHAIFLIG